MTKIYTARINYTSQEHVVLNTTAKSGSGLGRVFAPTWGLVMDIKNGVISWQEYTLGYGKLIYSRYPKAENTLIEILKMDSVVLTCYCADTHDTTKHCHRYILVDILEKVANRLDLDFKYMGEIS